MLGVDKKDIATLDEVKNQKKVGKGIECKNCKYVVEGPNLQSAMMKMAIHKRLFKHMNGVKTYDIYE